MCTSYGVDPARLPSMRGLNPLDEKVSGVDVAQWMTQFGGHAKITGINSKNLNPVITQQDNERYLRLGWWSLWRDGSGPIKPPRFNARDDSLMRYWRSPFQHRALLPASWYDEGRRRWTLPDGSGFAIAAITTTVIDDDSGKEVLSYSMVTRTGVGEAASVISKRGDSRMPLVIPTELRDEWLDPKRAGDAQLVDQVLLASDELSRSMTASNG